jgi:hypothetical protein
MTEEWVPAGLQDISYQLMFGPHPWLEGFSPLAVVDDEED